MLYAPVLAHGLDYLSVQRWRHRDGFFDATTMLNVSMQRTLLMPNVPSLHSTVQFVSINEKFLLHAILDTFRLGCSEKSMFLDTGSNDGMWTLLAAAHGCTVVAVEVQPYCVELLHIALLKNSLQQNVTIFHYMLSPHAAPAIMVPDDQCHGTAQFLGSAHIVTDTTGPGRRFRKERIAKNDFNSTPVYAKRVDSLVRDDVELWHLDVEGAEILVLQSASLLFTHNRVKRVLMEFIPARWGPHDITLMHGLSIGRTIFHDWRCISMCPPWPTFDWTITSVRKFMETGSVCLCTDIYCVSHRYTKELDFLTKKFERMLNKRCSSQQRHAPPIHPVRHPPTHPAPSPLSPAARCRWCP